MNKSSTRALAIADVLKSFRSPDLWGYVIARLEVTASSQTEQGLHWRNARMVVLRHPLGADQLTVLLVKPPTEPISVSVLQEAGDNFCTKAQIDAYLQHTGDDNPIHRGPAALVPGLLVLSELEKQSLHEPLRLFSVQFKSALRVNEPFVVDRQELGPIQVKKTDGTLILRLQL
ncbi:hypothetical protein BWI93_00235 [Siphonobacter sp. BAB-5385]|uniref:hypothetical protein n=1 Tax=Siphonobacter sp. BAB-5385 TaxID=1864822 RepID=UPI000B9EA97A|nr:hypothetical protein [Siphonobacter sp. BAB-5385]OZI10142.1 hypothetical protein BWI93_00235 [Siphonobacter sp. BAB-5385]